jgi:phage terminase large subunit-like protein
VRRPLDHAGQAEKYADQVASGKVPSSKWQKKACERFILDKERGRDRGLSFDRAAANRVCHFVELLPHIKGKWAQAGETISLEPWQKFILCNPFGWKQERNEGPPLRRFRTVYEEVPRKNAKSTKIAGVALYMLGPDEEAGAEIYSAATTREQASIVFGVARHMALRTPRYRQRFGVDVFRHAVVREETAATLKALSSEHDTLDGLNSHFVALDEVHAAKNRALYDVLQTSMGSRQQPILWGVTTAGGNQEGICYELRDYLCKVLDGVLQDDSFFGIIYTVDDPEQWEDTKQWRIANPNYGVSVLPESLEDGARKARHSAAALNSFKTKHLDVWVSAAAAWMNMEEWKACGVPGLRAFAEEALKNEEGRKSFGIPPDFNGRECWIGGDLSSKVDIADLAFIFPDGDGGATVFGRHYLPKDLVEEHGRTTGAHYLQWAKDGWLTLTSGNAQDFDLIEADIKAAAERFRVLGYAHDPWQSHQMVQHLQAADIQCIEVKPMVSTFSPAMKEVEALVKAKKLRHNGDPCATWQVSNVVAKEDFKQNVYPRKEKRERKIDFFVALCEGMERFVVTTETPEPLCDCAEPNPDEAGLCLVCLKWTPAHGVATVL